MGEEGGEEGREDGVGRGRRGKGLSEGEGNGEGKGRGMDVEGVKGRGRVRERAGEEGERRRVEEGGRGKGEEGGAGGVAHPPGCRVDDRCSGAGVETMSRRHGPLLPNQRAAADRTAAISNKQFSKPFKGKRYTRCR